MNYIKKIIKKILPEDFKEYLKIKLDIYSKKSYSQEGEDLLLKTIFSKNKFGFYVDIGAFHPIRFSNTYLFYKNGWRGINIDAAPNSMRLFNKFRPKDINLEIGVSNKRDELIYYIFNEQAFNTFDKTLAYSRNGINNYFIIKEVLVKVQPLSEILDEYLPKNQEISFFDIDVEGFDYKILESNNWVKYRPKVLLIEILKNSIESILENEKIYYFLKDLNYIFFAKIFNSCFFIEKDFYIKRIEL